MPVLGSEIRTGVTGRVICCAVHVSREESSKVASPSTWSEASLASLCAHPLTHPPARYVPRHVSTGMCVSRTSINQSINFIHRFSSNRSNRLRRALLSDAHFAVTQGDGKATPDHRCGVAASGAACECSTGQSISGQALTTRFWLQPRAFTLISENLCRHAWWPHPAVVEEHSYQRCCGYGGVRGTSTANYAAKEGAFPFRLPLCRVCYFASGWEITGAWFVS
jgi:hypothetical protein